MLLAIDTSTRQASVALYDPARGLLGEQSWFSANRHTEELMPAVSALLRLADKTSRDLSAVGVAIGPGSFTGLRVGLAAAKGLALARGLPLAGIPTLDITASPHQAQPVPVIAVAQAGRGRVYWAPYAHGPSGWGPQEAYALSTVPEVANVVVRAMAFAGELTEADRETLERFAGRQRVTFLSSALGIRRAGILAELALRRLEMGQADDPAALSPIYLQHPDGTKTNGSAGGGSAAGGGKE
jgi:tRNA threonylcarbamoyladenosine biosynthesis protein TsaB